MFRTDACAVYSSVVASKYRVLQTSIPRIPKRIFQLAIPIYYSMPFTLSLTSIQFANQWHNSFYSNICKARNWSIQTIWWKNSCNGTTLVSHTTTPSSKLWILNQNVSAYIFVLRPTYYDVNVLYNMRERMKNVELVILECFKSLFILPFRFSRSARIVQFCVCRFVRVTFIFSVTCKIFPHCEVCCHRKNLSFHIKLLLVLECVERLVHNNLLQENFLMLAKFNAFVIK